MPRPRFTIIHDTDHERSPSGEAQINIFTRNGDTGFLTYPELKVYIAELRTLYDDHFSGE